MSIANRKLKAGTRLVATYKGKEYTAEVVEKDGSFRYRLKDGREFKSPSSAGSAIMEGTACNGWRFWSIADGRPISAPTKSRKANAGNTKAT